MMERLERELHYQHLWNPSEMRVIETARPTHCLCTMCTKGFRRREIVSCAGVAQLAAQLICNQ